jgi:hypothetical protein
MIVVTSTADSGAGSLRQALADVNDGDTIQFDPALNGQTITLTSDELVIDSNVTISGPGPNLLTVAKTSSIPPRFRIFHVMPSRTVTIEGLTIRNGYADASFGGGILNDTDTTLTISNCTVSDNVSDAGSGGGGIYSRGTLTIVNSTVSNNWAGFTNGFPIGTGGGIRGFGTITIIHSTINNNTALFDGGGIFSQTGAILAITNSSLSGNFAYQSGGGVAGGTLTITNSTVSGNQSNGGAGGISTGSNETLEIGNTILNRGASGANIVNNGGTVISRGYNLSSDNGSGFLTANGDQIKYEPDAWAAPEQRRPDLHACASPR